MKRVYKFVLVALCVLAALTFLPWLYDIAFPAEDSEPFVVWSPVSQSFIVSESGETPKTYAIDSAGNEVMSNLTKTDRDSLVPQIYYTQLSVRGQLPDTIDGRAVDAATFKKNQWVFNSLPRDINRVDAKVYPIMESRPKRVDLEDPTEVFTLDGDIRFIDMATNTVNEERSRRFSKVFAEKRFAYPALVASAEITAKKAYDEGYLLIDADHKLYHMKMQAGQPYLAEIETPLDDVVSQAFILENPDMRQIGLVATSDGLFFAIEREGYRPVRLPLKSVDPRSQRITIMKNLFNWVIRVSDNYGTRWTAIDSDDYSLLGEYYREKPMTKPAEISRWIFPFRISFTSINDCYAYPRISDFSIVATLIWLAVIAIILIIRKNNLILVIRKKTTHMKKINLLLSVAVLLIAAGCANNAANTTTEAESTSMTVDSVLAAAPELVDSMVTIEGVCTHTCKHGATKMFLIGTDDSKTIRVEACQLGAFNPEVVNSLVKVNGYLRETRIDENYLAAWEEKIKENELQGHGNTGAGCDSERAARGVETADAMDQIQEYRRRIADNVAAGGNPWVSFYHIDAVDYEIL